MLVKAAMAIAIKGVFPSPKARRIAEAMLYIRSI